MQCGLNCNQTWWQIKETCLSKYIVPRFLNITLFQKFTTAFLTTKGACVISRKPVKWPCVYVPLCYTDTCISASKVVIYAPRWMCHLSSAENMGNLRKACNPPPLPPVQDFQYKRCLHEAGNIVSDPSHPLHRLFDPLPSGRRCRRIRARTMRMLNSFLPQPITLLNNNSIILIICPNNRPKVRHFLTPATYSHITLLSYSALFVYLCR